MLRRNLVLRLVSALAAVSATGLLPAAIYAASPSAAITKPAAGMASVVLINQDTGKNETLTVTFNGTPYTIAPQGGSSSNRVEFSLAPGSYDFTASVPGITSVSHSIYVAADKVTSLSFQDNAADMQNSDRDADDTAQTQQVVTVVGNESDEHETKQETENGTVKSEQKDSGPDGDEVHLQLGPSTVQDNDDILVTVGDMTAMAQ
jgi:hypothetical protein